MWLVGGLCVLIDVRTLQPPPLVIWNLVGGWPAWKLALSRIHKPHTSLSSLCTQHPLKFALVDRHCNLTCVCVCVLFDIYFVFSNFHRLDLQNNAYGSLVVHVRCPPYSSRPREYGWLMACAYRCENTPTPMLSRI